MHFPLGAIRGVVAAAALVAALWPAGPTAQTQPPRLTIWHLVLGTPVQSMPPWIAFKGYACGSNGGPPRIAIAGWSEYTRCRPEESGLREVYFEYDDELEYVARARDLVRDLPRVAGTTEQAFPIITSALFDEAGRLAGIRIVSDPRPDFRPDVAQSETRDRRQAHQLSGLFAARFGIDSRQHCQSLPPAEGESPVGDVFIKQVCEKIDAAARRRYVLGTTYLRKPGQYARNPYMEQQLTEGQFDSSTRLEIHLLPPAAGAGR